MCGIAVVWGGVRLRAASPDETASSMHRSSEDGSTQLAELTGACVELMVSTERAAEPSTMLENEVKAVLAQRGPDSSGALVVKPMDSYPPATLLGCTLGLRNEVAPQPVTTSDGAVSSTNKHLVQMPWRHHRLRWTHCRHYYGMERSSVGAFPSSLVHLTPSLSPPHWNARTMMPPKS
eukprot:SAG31_NODE_1516_length_8036_cov_2.800680_5_plen_178_part_00